VPVLKTQNDPIKHLCKDKTLAKVIRVTELERGRKDKDLYFALLRAIVGQQLSVKAAVTIWKRFLALFPDDYPSPEQVLQMPADSMRAAGLSFQKAGYLKNIAQFSIDKTLDYKKLQKLSDDELVEYLVQIKGVGRWTAEMILMFTLQREDVFPKDDLGIQTGISRLYGLKVSDKKKLFKQMDKISESWRPYRTLACLYIWRFKDDTPV
jgi:DNA-3-methyladenine glycosylase II